MPRKGYKSPHILRTQVCAYRGCKKEFMTNRESTRYCSSKCVKLDQVKMKVWLICDACGQPYLSTACRAGSSKYCSRKCQVTSDEFKRIQGLKLIVFNKTLEASETSRKFMTALNQNPEFKLAQAKKSSERLKSKWQTEDFRKSHSELSSKIMLDNWKDPEFVGVTSAAMGRLNRWDGKYPDRQRALYEELLKVFRFDCAYEYHVFVDMLEDAKVTFYRLDLAIISKMVNIEVDGWSHNGSKAKEYDKARDNALCQLGWKVIRVRNEEIDKDLDSVVQHVIEMIKDLNDTPENRAKSQSHKTQKTLASRQVIK